MRRLALWVLAMWTGIVILVSAYALVNPGQLSRIPAVFGIVALRPRRRRVVRLGALSRLHGCEPGFREVLSVEIDHYSDGLPFWVLVPAKHLTIQP